MLAWLAVGRGASGCALMVAGDGGGTTWLGAGLFIAALVAFGLVSHAGIERRNRRVEELIEE